MAVDYFTKWIEAEVVACIHHTHKDQGVRLQKYVCRYRVPHTIISDNGTQFDCDKVKELCDNLQIKKVLIGGTTSSQWAGRGDDTSTTFLRKTNVICNFG